MSVKIYVLKEIMPLIPVCDKLEIELYIDDIGYSVDYFVTINGTRRQCLDLIAEGTIDEKSYETAAMNIAKYIRKNDNYKKGEVNKYYFEIS